MVKYTLRHKFAFRLLPAVVCLIAATASAQYDEEAGVQVLTRGPVHEAFAGASRDDVTGGNIISRAPYEAIVELPPDHRPEGSDVAWIPGYWSWDEDRNDYLWVSGVWRDIPPGRQWVPGYWATVRGGSQWVSGFWGEVAQTEVVYLPPPPATLETGPSSPPPPGNQWMPGCWMWQRTRYDWQPGYWVVQQADWVWSPPRYTWTPRGYVYVQGYWDYDIARRGVIFAPVYYDQPVYQRQGYAYSPRIIIDIGAIALSLFVQSRSNHYYFGDYYDRRYEERGYHPWYDQRDSHYGLDPIYAHYRSRQLQRDPQWDHYIEDRYRYRRDNVDARPAPTLNLQININSKRRDDSPSDALVGRRFEDAVRGEGASGRFRPLELDERKQYERRGRDVQDLQRERKGMEQRSDEKDAAPDTGENQAPVRMPMRVSPIGASTRDESTEGRRNPPPRPDMPAPREMNPRERKQEPTKTDTSTGRPASQRKPGTAHPDRGAPPAREDAQSPRRVEAPGGVSPRKSADAPEMRGEPRHEAPPKYDDGGGSERKQRPAQDRLHTPARKKGAVQPEVQLPQPRKVRNEAQEPMPRVKDSGSEKGGAPSVVRAPRQGQSPRDASGRGYKDREPNVGSRVKR
jgi:hypothetical protein